MIGRFNNFDRMNESNEPDRIIDGFVSNVVSKGLAKSSELHKVVDKSDANQVSEVRIDFSANLNNVDRIVKFAEKYPSVKDVTVNGDMKSVRVFFVTNLRESGDMMTDEEVKEEVLEKIKHLGDTANTWASRDTLIKFTHWGFWSGNVMAIINVKMAKQVAEELYAYVDSLPAGHGDIEEVYNNLY